MNDASTEAYVSRARYERERRARNEAESLLEAKARELYEANQNLIRESESVRSALAETEALRQREATALMEQSILAEVLTALSGKSTPAEAMQALLEVLQRKFAIFDVYFAQAKLNRVSVTAAARSNCAGLVLPLPASHLERACCIPGFTAVAPRLDLPGPIRDLASVIIAPLRIPGEDPGALILGCERSVRFSADDLRLVERIADLAVPVFTSLREARRNALLISLIEGHPVPEGDGILDAPLEAVHRAFARLTDMQGTVVQILDALLSAPLAEADSAIQAALASMGELTGADRICVSRLHASDDVTHTTHEWCAAGIAPRHEMHRRISRELIDHWRAVFEASGQVQIPNVGALPDTALEKRVLADQDTLSLLAVPMVENGSLRGFIGYETILAPRNFLPGEVHLIQSVAKVIISVLARRDAESELFAANAKATAQRVRLEAVLSAMPDLVIELDRVGRFAAWHSGVIAVPPTVRQAFAGRSFHEVLPPDLGAEARNVLAEIDRGAKKVDRELRFALSPNQERLWQLSASPIGAEGYLFVLRDITEARAQTAEIERLSEIARRTTNLVVVTDAERRIEWVNAAFESTTGWRLDEVRGQKPGSFLQTEATDPATLTMIRAELAAARPVQAEILNRSRAGRDYWVALDIHPLRRTDGTLQGFMAVQTDVTERRNQAERLRKAAEDAATAHATLEAAVEALQDGFVLYDADDQLVICNQKYREIYAHSAPAIVPGASYEGILRYGLDRGEYANAAGGKEKWLAEQIARHRKSNNQIEQELSDGRWLRIFEKATPDGGHVGLHVDITAMKLAEKRALSDLATAMEASQDGIAITDVEGRFLYMNRAHLEMFGLNSETEAVGQPWTMLYSPEATAWMRANAMPQLSKHGRWSGEIVGRAKDGSPVDQDVSLTLKEDGGILCITRDVSLRRREAAERDRLRDELQLAQRREFIGQMAAGLAHDFNNSLATISGSAALIEGATEPGSASALAAHRIVAASDQAAGLVKRLMALGSRPSERSKLDLRKPVAQAAELVRASLRAPITVTVDLPPNPVEALADPTDILQLVLNLTINSRDAIGNNLGEIAIRLSKATSDDLSGPFALGSVNSACHYVCLTVVDNGPGMTSELIGKVFRPWFSTKGERGTGLGLAIVASVVGANGGAVRLESEPGQGTRFRVLWPVESARPFRPNADGPLRAPTGRLDGRTVLVVDDQPEILDILTAFLEAAGAEVAPSTDPRDALEALAEDPGAWDLLVTDFDMPGLTGVELADAARARVPGLPVILVTALPHVANRTGTNFDAVLGKPVVRTDLVYAAERVMRRAQTTNN